MEELNQTMLNTAGTKGTSQDPNTDDKPQVNAIKENANALLYQLMQEQNMKLKSMVDALKQNQMLTTSMSGSHEKMSLSQPKSYSDVGSKDRSKSHESQNANNQANIKPTMTDISSLQQDNLLHLDAVINRINATMTANIDSIETTLEPVVKPTPATSESQ